MRVIIILLLFQISGSVTIFGQLKMDKQYYCTNGSFCSTSLVFCTDSVYYYEHGCEGSSGISAGKWAMKKDTVIFMPFNNKTQTFVESVTATQVPGDSVYVTVLDKNGDNITSIVSMGIYVANLGLYPFTDLREKRNVAYRRPGGKLYLKKLAEVFRRDYTYDIDSANSFIIKLNVPRWFFKYDAAEWQNKSNFKLVYKAGKLVDTNAPPDYPVEFSVSE
jgi:hypothetical protein